MEWKKYAYTFLITAVIFATAIMMSSFFSQKKMNEIKNIESRIAVDILASETQFSLLSELTCRDISSNFLSKELAELGDKLSYTEQNRGSRDTEVINLKRYYSLLQIKDFLLMQKIKDRCGNDTLFIIYFYSNLKDKCPDCSKEGLVLTRLRQEYPDLRVYSFDYDLDLSALQTLISIYDIRDVQPALIVNDKVYYGYISIEEIKEIMPELKEIDKLKALEAEENAGNE
jgi:thiol-disulfide isomerase/thioredoxin